MYSAEKRRRWREEEETQCRSQTEGERLCEVLIRVTVSFTRSSNPHITCFIQSAESAFQQSDTPITGPEVSGRKPHRIPS